MQSFAKNEIIWILEAVNMTAAYYDTLSHRTSGAEAQLAALRSGQLTGIAERLNKVLETGSKRIEIQY